MNIIFIETPVFVKKIDKIDSQEAFIQLQDELSKDPYKGKIVKSTGGARKIRMKLQGRSKSASARVIYYYVDLRGEIWFLDLFEKKNKESLTDAENKKLLRFIKEVINAEE